MARPLIDFGLAAEDYARHRPGFPDDFFDYVLRYGIGGAGQRVLDVGTGTGALARGFARQGCRVVGLDPSPEMLTQAAALGQGEGVRVHLVRGWVEAMGLAPDAFDVVCAGQCWHWFDRTRAAVEVARVVRSGGRVLVAYFTYLSDAGTVGAATEGLILKHNPSWHLAGSDGRQPWVRGDLETAGLRYVDTFEFDLAVALTHAAWRGRIRASNGVLMMPADVSAAFDAELAALLAREYQEPLLVPHRIFGVVAEKA